jgi:hypothetical protein
MLDRDEARRTWADTGLLFESLRSKDLSDLRARLDQEMCASGLIRGSFRMHRGLGIRYSGDRLVTAELRCRSDYFEDRQAVTFEQSGFIGFAGWADEVNVQPILLAFTCWSRELEARRVAA